ncbi:MAG: hypothetical protein M1833_003435 [Piccolia ochrophora]|nr:MAG: hypothetical protein M1833_003435 [Piccolia ochrophora]
MKFLSSSLAAIMLVAFSAPAMALPALKHHVEKPAASEAPAETAPKTQEFTVGATAPNPEDLASFEALVAGIDLSAGATNIQGGRKG